MKFCNLRILLKLFKFNSIPDKILTNITMDSRLIKKNGLFIAIRGHKLDGYKYILEAIFNGASAVLTETKKNIESGTVQYIFNTPIIYIKNLKDYLSLIGSRFNHNPEKKLKLVAVTGTNGKTTITHLIAQLVNYMGEKSAIISTIGNGILNNIVNTKNTTDSAIEIQNNLKFFYENNVNLVVVETSSHALVQKRVLHLPFEVGVFSNLTPDHLDYHKNLEAYESAKWLLFSTHKTKNQVINIDDIIGLKWIKSLPKACIVSIKQKIPTNFNGSWIKVNKVNIYNKISEIFFSSIWGNGIIQSSLVGYFNISNLMLSIATLLMLNYPFDLLIECSNRIKIIPGRMEPFFSSKWPTVFVDYAHNPDALKNALLNLRIKTKGKIWCIFGCGGERCKNRRFLMGRIAEKYSDFVIITNDNPRYENENSIIKDILSGFINPNFAIIIKDRINAIQYAILKANKNDLILVSGKGHEEYQLFKNIELFHSDRLVVSNFFKRK